MGAGHGFGRRRARGGRALALRARPLQPWLAALALAARVARAEPTEPSDAPAPNAPQTADAARDANAPDVVEAWFEQANLKFAAHDYAGALALLERACAASDFPGCALNLGAVHHALRHCVEARHYYGAYLRNEPSGERAAEARAALDELDVRCRDEGARSAAVTGASAPSASSPPPAPPALPAADGALREGPSSQAPEAPPSAPAASGAPTFPPRHGPAAPPAAFRRGVLGAGSSANAMPSTLDEAPRYRAVAASVMVLGGAAGLTSIYLGSRLADANDQFDEHKREPYDEAQARRLERAREYRALTIGSGVASAVLLGVGGVFWWLGADADAGVGVALDEGARLQLSGRF
ncbi:MAG TPA: hypothetical protein VMG12_31590 [Polyangiaceae bacterium]|nr:hypothetical protein [Polyangiaceae bacterium]